MATSTYRYSVKKCDTVCLILLIWILILMLAKTTTCQVNAVAPTNLTLPSTKTLMTMRITFTPFYSSPPSISICQLTTPASTNCFDSTNSAMIKYDVYKGKQHHLPALSEHCKKQQAQTGAGQTCSSNEWEKEKSYSPYALHFPIMSYSTDICSCAIDPVRDSN